MTRRLRDRAGLWGHWPPWRPNGILIGLPLILLALRDTLGLREIAVVAANRGVLPEVVGEAGILVDPDDVNELAQAIHRLLTDEAFAIACAERGLARARLFSWDRAAMALHRAYEAAHANRRRDPDHRRD